MFLCVRVLQLPDTDHAQAAITAAELEDSRRNMALLTSSKHSRSHPGQQGWCTYIKDAGSDAKALAQHAITRQSDKIRLPVGWPLSWQQLPYTRLTVSRLLAVSP